MANDIEQHVALHYAQDDLERTILRALAASGKDTAQLAASDLAPVDEFHSGGRQATIELAAQLGITPDMHLLDVGCGIGGPSRYFAEAFGCRVTGVDLTAEYVRTAEALARRVGLSDRVAYRQASALALPFAPATFDGGYMMHVGMNIADKPGLFAGIRTVLKPAAIFAVYDVMRVGPGDLRFPAHWARSAETSFVAPPAEYRRALEAAGFEVQSERARDDFAGALVQDIRARQAEGAPPPPLGLHILLRTEVAQKLANVVSNLERGIILPVELICRAR